jgi:hypothetical protein
MEKQPSVTPREFLAYAVLVVGVVMDQFTTRYGLLVGFQESNPVASWLIQTGLWFIVDFMLVVSVIGLSIYVCERLEKVRDFVFFYPFIFGLVRLYAGVRNLGLFV